jgi:hypothetical protein
MSQLPRAALQAVAQEGRSDLSLELELREAEPGAWETRVLDLHVL